MPLHIPEQLQEKANELEFKRYAVNYCGKGEMGVHIVAKKISSPNPPRFFCIKEGSVVEFKK